MLIGAGEGIEKRRLAAVLVSGQRKYHSSAPPFSSIFLASSTRSVSS